MQRLVYCKILLATLLNFYGEVGIDCVKVAIRELKQSEVKAASSLLLNVIKGLAAYYTPRDILRNKEDYSPENIERLMRRGGSIFRIATVGGTMAGIAVADLYPSIPSVCWITWIAVKKSYRHKGIGTLLVRSFEIEPARRWDKIQCRVRVGNVISNDMFKKLGYKRIRMLRRKIRMRRVYVWEKPLNR